MHTTVSKAMRVGKATMLAIGVGVALALLLGFTTVALAAVPGDPFKLGKVNVINNATTTLQGSGLSGPLSSSVLQVKRDGTTGGPALRVDNTSTSGAARGIDINVPAGETPINVNSGARKADLDVDRFDGKDEQDFLSASRVYRVGTPAPVGGKGNGDSVLLTALDGLECDDEYVAIGGGGNAVDIEDDLNAVIPASSSSYQIEFQDNGSPDKFTGFVLCSDSDKPFK